MKIYLLIFSLVLYLLPVNTFQWNLFRQKTTPELCELGCECPESDKSFLFLDCTNKGIRKLPEGITFDTQITKVSFKNNLLTTLGKGSFYRTQSVEEMDLSLNGLTSVAESIFKGFSSLAQLSLSHNQLTSVPPGLLDGLDNLRLLELGHNKLENLPGNLFEPTRNLRELRLRYNHLRSLRKEIFKWIPLLERLDLENTGLLRIPQELFETNLNLNWLSLAGNDLTRVPTEAFRKTSRLSSLDMSGNLFEVLWPRSFSTLTNLSHLSLNSLSRLTKIDRMAFYGMENLKSLSCSFNDKLTVIHPEAFGKNATIPREQLFLQHNSLNTLKLDLAHMSQMTYVDLRENPWNCDCRMTWMAELEWQIKDTVRCKNPAALRDQPLSIVPKEELICTSWLLSTALLLFAAVLVFILCLIAACVAFCPRSYLGLRVRSKKQFSYAKVVPKTDSVDLEWDPTGDV